VIDGEWKTHFMGYDGHGSVRFLTDINGNVTDSMDYDSFGILINRTGNTPVNHLYAGEYYDEDLGMYYMRARDYNQNSGRFFTQDSFEGTKFDPVSLHKYTYGNGNPINNIDPTGHFSVLELGIALTLVTIGVMFLTSCNSGFLSPEKKPRKVFFNFNQMPTNGWKYSTLPAEPLDLLTPAEIDTIKNEAIQTFQRALKDWNVDVVSNGGVYTNELIIKSAAPEDIDETSITGSTKASTNSYLYLNPEIHWAKYIGTHEGKSFARSEIVKGAGRGLGHSSAHEFFHQIGYGANLPLGAKHSEDVHDITLGATDRRPYFSEAYDMFYGYQVWPGYAIKVLDAGIPRR
jgi:RHS repeat-associated protein